MQQGRTQLGRDRQCGNENQRRGEVSCLNLFRTTIKYCDGKRIKEAYDTGDFTEEEKKRIEFAVILHRKNAQRLKELIHKAEVEGTSMYLGETDDTSQK